MIITNESPYWEELMNFLKKTQWVFIHGTISGMHTYTHGFKLIVGETSDSINERKQEGIIEYMTQTNGLGSAQNIAIKWEVVEVYHVLLQVISVEEVKSEDSERT